MLTHLLSKGFKDNIKHCQITDRVRREYIWNAGLS